MANLDAVSIRQQTARLVLKANGRTEAKNMAVKEVVEARAGEVVTETVEEGVAHEGPHLKTLAKVGSPSDIKFSFWMVLLCASVRA